MLFLPIADNPLHKNHLNGAFHNPFHDSLASNETLPKSSVWDGLYQKTFVVQKSCLKNSSPKEPSPKQLVKWSNPLSTSRIIPARDDPLNDMYVESSNPNAGIINIGQNHSKPVLGVTSIVPSSTDLDAFSPPSQEFSTQAGNSAADGFQLSSIENSALDIETLSITKVENNIEGRLFGTIYFPLTKPGKSVSQAEISPGSQSAVPVAFAADGWHGQTSHEITTKLNLRHLSRSLSQNPPSATHHSLSPNIPLDPTSTLYSGAFLPPTKSLKSLATPILSQGTQTFSESSISIAQETVHHPSSTPHHHSFDPIPISPPGTKVFGSRNSNQQSQTSSPRAKGIKRKAITGVEKFERPSKFTKVTVDQNVEESPVRQLQETSSSSVNFQALNPHVTSSSSSLSRGSVGNEDNEVEEDSDAEGPATSDDPDSDSEDDSLFGDSFVNDKPRLVHPDKQAFAPPANHVLSGRSPFKFGKYSRFRNKFKRPVRSYRPITQLVVIRWVNELKRFQYLRDSGKLDQKIVGELHQLLNDIDRQKSDSFLTPKVLGEMRLGRLVSEFRHGMHGRASKVVADSIVKFWRHRCREVESGNS